jgi:hypothetical protein
MSKREGGGGRRDLHGKVNVDEEEDEWEHEVDGRQSDVDQIGHDFLAQ